MAAQGDSGNMTTALTSDCSFCHMCLPLSMFSADYVIFMACVPFYVIYFPFLVLSLYTTVYKAAKPRNWMFQMFTLLEICDF